MKEQKISEAETAGLEIIMKDSLIQGLDCADCAQLLEKAVCKVKGVPGAQADFVKSSLRVEYAPEQVQSDEINRRWNHEGKIREEPGKSGK